MGNGDRGAPIFRKGRGKQTHGNWRHKRPNKTRPRGLVNFRR